MKPILVIVAFLLWGGNQTFAQATKCTNTATYCGLLAPNPGCAGNAPYCRAAITAIIPSDSSTIPQIIGSNKGILYSALAVTPPKACPQSSVSASTSPKTLCFYSSTSFNPESWQYLGQYSLQKVTTTFDGNPIEVVFAPSPCSGANYQYLYTEGAHLLRAPFNDWNNFSDIISNINFSGQGIPPNIPPDTSGRPGSFAIGADSSGGVRLFYGNYNDHSYPPSNPSPPQPAPPGGLIWHSTDCRGDSWSQPFTFGGREVHTVNADPVHPSNIYTTIDAECSDDQKVCPPSQQPRGLWGSTNSGDNFTQLASAANSKLGIDFVFLSKGVVLEADDCASGPLLYQDLVANHPMEVQAKWPDSTWQGNQLGIKLTSAGNIFVISDFECNGRWGIWYVLQPAYSGAILLENMGSTAPGPKINRTVEIKDPTTNVAYLYNYMTRFAEPIASPTPLVSEPLGNKPWDLGVWVGGGFSVPGGTTDTQVVNAGVRLGKVLTGNHGSGFFRGNFEWSADVMPLYYLVQPGQNAYAAGFNPVNLKWNFTSHSKVVPYLELGGGVLFSNNNVPAVSNTNTNFLTHAALGFHFFTHENRAFTLSTRYEHISNAGLASPNPGINTVQFAVGFNWFKKTLP